jgi:ribosome maturation factor RimP
MTTAERVQHLVAPLLEGRGLDLYDLELGGGVLKVTVDRRGGVDLDEVAQVTRAVSRVLDEADPIPGRYTLEVTTPGVERRLRTPAHFARAVGESVKVKLRPGAEGERRVEGTLTESDEDGISVQPPEGEERRIALDEIDKARTVLQWGPLPKAKRAPDEGSSDGAARRRSESRGLRGRGTPTAQRKPRPAWPGNAEDTVRGAR